MNIAGAFIMFLNTPKLNSRLYIGQSSEYKAMEKADKRRNQMMRLGIGLLVIGFLLQILALTADHFK